MFDWQQFLSSHNVEWRTSGPNISRGSIGICCPWCGSNDTNFHMGINTQALDQRWSYSCWKDQTHRGNTPYYLIQKIAKCSKPEAIRIYEGAFTAKVELNDILTKLEQTKQKYPYPPIGFSIDEFRLSLDNSRSQPFFDYLVGRGFKTADLEELCSLYKLRGSLMGEFSDRLIMPFYVDGALVGWTGRDIGVGRIRYKTAPSGVGSGRYIISNFDQAKSGGKYLFICEGPFDEKKVDFYGRRLGARAVSVLGLALTPGKISLISRLAPLYEKLVVCLDQGTLTQGLHFQGQLAALGREVVLLNIEDALPGTKDPGELDEQGVSALVNFVA